MYALVLGGYEPAALVLSSATQSKLILPTCSSRYSQAFPHPAMKHSSRNAHPCGLRCTRIKRQWLGGGIQTTKCGIQMHSGAKSFAALTSIAEESSSLPSFSSLLALILLFLMGTRGPVQRDMAAATQAVRQALDEQRPGTVLAGDEQHPLELQVTPCATGAMLAIAAIPLQSVPPFTDTTAYTGDATIPRRRPAGEGKKEWQLAKSSNRINPTHGLRGVDSCRTE